MIATTEQLAANAATDDQRTDIEPFLTLLHGGGGFEVRSFGCPTEPGSKYKATASGYFVDTSLAAKMIRQIERRKPPGIYTTLNPVKASVMGRSFNAINWKSNKATDDNEIARVRNILADVDPSREPGTPSTDAEMHRALEITEIIIDGVTAIGLPTPKMQGMSGNGASLIFGADIAVEENHLVVAMLEFLSDRHADELARGPIQVLDQSTSSISQLTKVLGTWARKGSNTPEIVTPDSISDPRPHRQSWYRTFDEPGVITAEMLRDILPTKYIDDAKKKADTPTKANRPVARPRVAPVAKPIKHSGGYDDSKHYASVINDACVGRCRDVITSLTTITHDDLDQHGTDKPCPKCGGNSRFYVCKHGGGVDEHGQVHCRRCMGGATANVVDTVRRFGNFDQTPAGYWRACDAIAEYLGLEVYDGDDFDADPLADIKAQEALIEAEYGTEGNSGSEPTDSVASLDRVWLRDSRQRNDNRMATMFIDRFGSVLRYVPDWKRWIVWDGQRFQLDTDSSMILGMAREQASDVWKEFSKLVKDASFDYKERARAMAFCHSVNSKRGIESVIGLSRSDERVRTGIDSLDSHKMLINLTNGTLDLASGEFREHRQSDLMTQIANVAFDAGATCPKWDEHLRLIFDGDDELIRYVQQLFGYSITGDTGEHILPIAYGTGRNGKSTVWNTIVELIGDYGALSNDSLLMSESNAHPTEKAALYQKRIVAISEPEQGAKLKESRVKELTGDALITARRMKEDFWTFRRTHTFWMSTNHLPRITGTDSGIWRRIKLIPFTVDIQAKVSRVIPDFHLWLVENEGSGILNWLLAGYRDYQENGFIEPEVVKKAVAGYRGTADPISDFVADCCEVCPDADVPASEVFAAYRRWGGDLTQTMFGRMLGQKFDAETPTSGHYRRRKIYKGIRLIPRENDMD